MPELPDITVYVEALERRVTGALLHQVRIASPFVLRSVDPPIGDAAGRRVVGVRRMGKRIVLELDADRFLILHLMIAGRLRWRPRGAAVPKGRGLAALDFAVGTVLFTEEGKQHRAGLWLVRGDAALAAHDPGGLEPLEGSFEAFRAALTKERHTLKRALTDPQLFSGIGNAYSDEILHAARLSPLQLTTNLPDAEIARLYEAARRTLTEWTDRLRVEAGDGFPEKVTAFREGMAVHGRFREPCPVCGSPVQRIRYAENEVNYCAACQTGGRLLADRALSRLLREDWPRSLDEWEARVSGGEAAKRGSGEG
ncbi:MAG TPA: DNA-formamidopyrimidine glycosylase family protein [Gemmatimonadales bacterium]|nr:DNA-formamidopyrimidine glycosylase family protein [Gemmatimonadales bacterium]